MQNGCGSTKKGKKLYKLVHSFMTIHRYERRSRGKQQTPKKISISMDRES